MINMGGKTVSARPVITPFLMLETNISIEGEREVTGVDNTTHRTVIPLKDGVRRGALSRVKITITAKAGTNATAMDTTILDTDLLTAAVDGRNTIFRSTADAVNGAVVEDQVFDVVRPDEILFVCKGTVKNAVQVVFVLTGSDGSTNYTINVQIYGEAHG